MSVLVICEACQRKLRVSESFVGKTIKCPACGHANAIRPARSVSPDVAMPPETGVPPSEGKSVQPGAEEDQKQGASKKTPVDAAKRFSKSASPVHAPSPASKASAKPAKDQTDESRPLLKWALPLLIVLGAGFTWFYFLGSVEEVKVLGHVTLDGKPLARAQVIFLGEDEKNKAPIAAATQEDGGFTLSRAGAGGVAPGKYKVVITKMALKDGTLPTGKKLENAQRQDLLINILPKVYEHYATTPLQVTVTPGDNSVLLELKKRP